jgi:DUF4097 and DUF4098 domain-containing protein YvlB
LPEGSSFALTAKTASGRVSVDFPLDAPLSTRRNEVKGQTDSSPQASLDLEAASGSIRVLKA